MRGERVAVVEVEEGRRRERGAVVERRKRKRGQRGEGRGDALAPSPHSPLGSTET